MEMFIKPLDKYMELRFNEGKNNPVLLKGPNKAK